MLKSNVPAVNVFPVEVSVSEKYAIVPPIATAPTTPTIAKLNIIFFHITRLVKSFAISEI